MQVRRRSFVRMDFEFMVLPPFRNRGVNRKDAAGASRKRNPYKKNGTT